MRFLPRPLRTLFLSSKLVFTTLLLVLATIIVLLSPAVYMVVKYGISVEFLVPPLDAAMMFLVIVYGFLRGWRYHPAFYKAYRLWLQRTPWTPVYPLPKGPLHLGWSDLFIVMEMTAIRCLINVSVAPFSWWNVLSTLILFATTITLAWSTANAATGQYTHLSATFAVPVFFGILQVPLRGFAICPFVMAAIAWHGVRCSLDSFPWPDRDFDADDSSASRQRSRIVGWPTDYLLQSIEEFRTSSLRAWVEALLVGGWTWFVFDILTLRGAVNVSEDPNIVRPLLITIACGATVIAVARIVGYAPVICRTLCWGNRVANRQWIIPHHDQIFLAPLLIVVMGVLVPRLLFHGLGASIALSCGLTASAVVLIGRRMGPSVQELQLTGIHSRFGRSWAERIG